MKIAKEKSSPANSALFLPLAAMTVAKSKIRTAKAHGLLASTNAALIKSQIGKASLTERLRKGGGRLILLLDRLTDAVRSRKSRSV